MTTVPILHDERDELGLGDDDGTIRQIVPSHPAFARGSRNELATDRVPVLPRPVPMPERMTTRAARGTSDPWSDRLRERDDSRPREPDEQREAREAHEAHDAHEHPAADRVHARAPERRTAAAVERIAERPAARPRIPSAPKRSAGESFARFLYFTSGAAIAAVVAVYGGRMWHDAHDRPAPVTAPATPVAAMAVIAANGRVELGPDHRAVTRLAGDAPRWAAPQSVPLDTIEITGPVVLGHTHDAIVALDLETGRTRFTWTPPGEEHWAAQRPVALGSCLVAITTKARKTALRCLDLATGAVRWTAALAGAGTHDCTEPPLALPGAVLMQCPGWTAVVDERTGAVSVEAGAAGLVQDQPPYLLRTHARLALAPWSPAKRKFMTTGELAYGTAATAATAASAVSSAVLYKDRLVLRATESSDELATIAPRDGAPTTIAAPVYRLADATPLVRSCGGETSPRFQLLELAPRIGATFDPATVGDRALALLDVEHGTLAWTSRKVTGLRATTGQAPLCRGGHYFLPIELPDPAGAPASILWVLDAETGKTAAAVAFDPDQGASFAQLTADQLDDDRIVAIGKTATIDARWKTPVHGLHDARHLLETALGPLP